MKDTKNITIAMLGILAVILASVIFLGNSQANATGASVRGGDYIMVNGSYSDGIDLIYVIDIAQQKLSVYAVDAIQNHIWLRDQLMLRQEFK